MTNRIADWQILAWLGAEKRTETGKTTWEITQATGRTWESGIRRRLLKLESEGKIMRIRHGHTDFWYLVEQEQEQAQEQTVNVKQEQ